MRRLVPLLLLVPLLSAFEWEGRLSRLERDFRTGDARQRREVVRLMASYPADQIREPLLAALQDDDPAVRREAAAAAGRARLGDAVTILIAWLEDADADIRALAARALGQIGDPRPTSSLIRALGDGSADVRKAAVLALADLGLQGADGVVVPLLGRLDDDAPEVRGEAASALARLGDERAVVPLVGRARDESPDVRVSVYRALGALGDSRAVAALVQSLRDESESGRLAAISALGRLGVARAVPALAELLRGRDARTSAATVAALGAIGTGDALDVVIASLANREVRETATDVLGTRPLDLDESGSDTLTLRLARALDDAEAHAHVTAIAEVLLRRLRRSRTPDAAPPILATLVDGRGAAPTLLRTLAATGSAEVLVPILERLESRDDAVQEAALDGLGTYFSIHRSDGRAADPLLAVLGSVPRSQRVQVVRHLGAIGAARALPAIRPLLEHPDPELRLAAVQAIGSIGDPEGAEAVFALLSDRDAQTRFEAAQALGNVADSTIVERLLQRIRSREPLDRHASLLAIGSALSRGLALEEGAVGRLGAALQKFAMGPDRRLAARAVDALSQWSAPAAQHVLRIVAERGGSLSLQRQAIRALNVRDERSRALLLQHREGRTFVNAAALALSRGGVEEVDVLLQILESGHWPAPSTAAFGLARFARAGQLRAEVLPRLCRALRQRDPYLRANLVVALAAMEARCEGEHALRIDAWMDRGHAPPVRAAVARWLAATEQAPPTLERCRREELTPEVIHACRSPELPPLGTTADVYAYAADGRSLLRAHLVALRFADGTAALIHTDDNGHVRMRGVAEGSLALDDPMRTPLDP